VSDTFEKWWPTQNQTIGKAAARAAWDHLHGGDTLAVAKTEWKQNITSGCECRCCGQHIQLWPRRIYSVMAFQLCGLYRLNDGNDNFHHIGDIPKPPKAKTGGGDFAKLRYWLLVEEMPPDPDGKSRSSGYWRITDHGKRFVEGTVKVPSVCNIYNKKSWSFGEGEMTNIKKALTEEYDYNQLIGRLI
jgi:hypothetical protein